mgnify:CR=1 FL=1
MTTFLDSLEQGQRELCKEPTGQALQASIEALSKACNYGKGKANKGLILLDKKNFPIPQLGEVIHDLFIL